ncbi:MAG: LysR family transcriptional regulator [Chloroflexota bacterium]|nr:LysR family transcriptional regulator [Hyphomonadaceae bacterium]GIK76289.1 MAG: LysR family transcriptional regulator [Chloroflexota bacterium]
MDLKHLRCIVAAADHPSLRQAAISLGVEQSKVTRSIRAVEAWLGIPLFERTNYGTAPTHAGVAFVHGARLIVEIADVIVMEAKATRRGAAGQLRVGLHTSLSAGPIRATLAAFKQKSPAVAIQVTEGSRIRLLAHARAGLIDVAFIAGDRGSKDLQCATAWSDKIVVAMPAEHSLAGKETIYWTDLADQPLLLSSRDPGPQLEAVLLSKLPSADMRRIQRHAVTHATLPQLAGAGLGIALICEASVECASHVVIREVRDAAGASGLPCRAHFRPDHESPALGVLLKLLRERYGC